MVYWLQKIKLLIKEYPLLCNILLAMAVFILWSLSYSYWRSYEPYQSSFLSVVPKKSEIELTASILKKKIQNTQEIKPPAS